jgi:hypothetical protein
MPVDYQERLNLREQIARIDRNQAEIQKLFAEQAKLHAEAGKFRWEHVIFIFGAIVAGVFLRLPEILHAFGHG